jgi:glycosidase
MSFHTPDWAKSAVWYQIFPERFRNGDPTNDPPWTVPWTHEWFKRCGRASGRSAGTYAAEKGDFYDYIYRRRYGGDLAGIREKLPYLRDLGITAIYLNPLFSAESLHKYDASDYRHIDDRFAVRNSLRKIKGETTNPSTWQWSESDRLFLDFLHAAHEMGFKVILDGVFNHAGRTFWAFQDILAKGKRSAYADWFDITSWRPLRYRAWDGDNGELPRLKHEEATGLSEPVRQHLFAVTRRWMDPDGDGDPADGIDGWRLDVAENINANFWRDWRRLVKSINPEAYLVGELWGESREWLDGETFDAAMNYPFAKACQAFFVNHKKAIRPKEFGRRLTEILGWYEPQVNLVQQNLLDSHDIDRVASMFMNPDLAWNEAGRLQDNNPNYNPARPTPDCYHKLKLAVLFQMTFLGAPMVYYGDEVGMYGADDPSNRKPMYWEDLMPYDDPDERIVPDLRDHYRRMIAIRNSCRPLQLGAFEVLLAKNVQRVFAFARVLDGDAVVVVLNNSDQRRRLDVPVPWPDGSAVLRLDDPHACEVVDPPASEPTARPSIRAIPGYRSPYRIADGRLKGGILPPRTGGVFKMA